MTTAVETIRDEPLTIGGRTFQSRLMVGTGKYPDMDTMVRAIEASGAEVVTVAVRRVNLEGIERAALPRSQKDFPARQHRRLLHGRRRDSVRATGARGRLQ